MAEERYDINGYDEITAALRNLLNTFPGLGAETITFSVLNEDGGKAMFPISGGIIVSEMTSITGHVMQTCQYPFFVIYRASGLSENNKANAKEWLDKLGKWLEKQTVTIGQTAYTLTEYPALTGQRRFTTIERTSPAYLDGIEENKAENWAIQLSAKYITEFYR